MKTSLNSINCVNNNLDDESCKKSTKSLSESSNYNTTGIVVVSDSSSLKNRPFGYVDLCSSKFFLKSLIYLSILINQVGKIQSQVFPVKICSDDYKINNYRLSCPTGQGVSIVNAFEIFNRQDILPDCDNDGYNYNFSRPFIEYCNGKELCDISSSFLDENKLFAAETYVLADSGLYNIPFRIDINYQCLSLSQFPTTIFPPFTTYPTLTTNSALPPFTSSILTPASSSPSSSSSSPTVSEKLTDEDNENESELINNESSSTTIMFTQTDDDYGSQKLESTSILYRTESPSPPPPPQSSSFYFIDSTIIPEYYFSTSEIILIPNNVSFTTDIMEDLVTTTVRIMTGTVGYTEPILSTRTVIRSEKTNEPNFNHQTKKISNEPIYISFDSQTNKISLSTTTISKPSITTTSATTTISTRLTTIPVTRATNSFILSSMLMTTSTRLNKPQLVSLSLSTIKSPPSIKTNSTLLTSSYQTKPFINTTTSSSSIIYFSNKKNSNGFSKLSTNTMPKASIIYSNINDIKNKIKSIKDFPATTTSYAGYTGNKTTDNTVMIVLIVLGAIFFAIIIAIIILICLRRRNQKKLDKEFGYRSDTVNSGSNVNTIDSKGFNGSIREKPYQSPFTEISNSTPIRTYDNSAEVHGTYRTRENTGYDNSDSSLNTSSGFSPKSDTVGLSKSKPRVDHDEYWRTNI